MASTIKVNAGAGPVGEEPSVTLELGGIESGIGLDDYSGALRGALVLFEDTFGYFPSRASITVESSG